MTNPNRTFQLIVDVIDVSEGRAYVARNAHENALMPLEMAIWAPELIGPLGFPAFTVLDLRGAIRRSELRPERHGHRILVTRRQLTEWRHGCRIQASQPLAASRHAQEDGNDWTAADKFDSTAVALAIAQRLKRASRSR